MSLRLRQVIPGRPLSTSKQNLDGITVGNHAFLVGLLFLRAAFGGLTEPARHTLHLPTSSS